MPDRLDRTEEPAHDVLAAEAFAMPAPDPALHAGPVTLPEDPTGIAEPHDVLAAEEFPMPAARSRRSGGLIQRARPARRSRRLAVLAGAMALWLLARVLRRR
jgi:hypothetical protein